MLSSCRLAFVVALFPKSSSLTTGTLNAKSKLDFSVGVTFEVFGLAAFGTAEFGDLDGAELGSSSVCRIFGSVLVKFMMRTYCCCVSDMCMSLDSP